MAIQSFGVATPLTSGYALQNATYRLDKERKRYSPPGGRNNYTTSYRENYRRWDAPRRQPFKPCDNLMVSTAKFPATTTYQVEYGYKAFPGKQVQDCKPAPKVTEYQPFKDMVPYALQVPVKPTQRQPMVSKLQGVIYNPNSTPSGGDGGIFVYGQAAKREAPEPAPVPTPAPPKADGESGGVVIGTGSRTFIDSTEYRDTYRNWPAQPVYQRQYPTYDPPKGNMRFVSSYAWDFRPWGVQTRPPILQKEQFVRPSGPFQHTTTYQADYTPKAPTNARVRPNQRR